MKTVNAWGRKRNSAKRNHPYAKGQVRKRRKYLRFWLGRLEKRKPDHYKIWEDRFCWSYQPTGVPGYWERGFSSGAVVNIGIARFLWVVTK